MKKNADFILKNALVITMDDDYNIYEPGAVAISGNEIIAVGDETQILQSFSSNEIFDVDGKVLMPGLINAHTHIPMTLLRGLADDLRLDVWLMGYMMPVEHEFVNSEFVYDGTMLGCAEFIRSGITTFADMYYFEDDVAEATAKAGLRGILGESVMMFPSPDAKSFEDSLEYIRNFANKWKNHPLIIPSIAPHAPYTNNDVTLQAATDLAQEFDIPLQIHISETKTEVDNMRSSIGMPVVPYVKKQRILDAKTIAAHCVHLDKGEIATLEHYGTGVAHNPSSNMKLASGAAPITEMLDAGLNVGIGTDGPASNNDLDMFDEIRLASFLSKVSTADPTALPARTTINMATHMGAKALYIDHLVGSLEVGKRADIILIDINRLHNMPRFKRDKNSIYGQLVYATKSTDVSDVIVDGKWLMKDRELLTIDEDFYLKKAEILAEKIDTFLIEREKSVLSKLIAIAGAQQEESFEIQIKVPVDDIDKIKEKIKSLDIKYFRHYREYDTYFHFDTEKNNLLRIREDDFIDDKGEVKEVRYRLTLVGESTRESNHVLSRSRYIAPSNQSIRFYREYFKPSKESLIEKDRFRWLINYKDLEFYINLDDVFTPNLGTFLEIKSRTWSRSDAETKGKIILEVLNILGLDKEITSVDDYSQLIK